MRPLFPNSARARRGGFTLVELLLVVMLLGIMAGVAAPQYANAIAEIEAETAARQLVADLRYTRRQAIRRGQVMGLRFDTTTGSYGSATGAGVTSVEDTQRPGRTLERDVADRSNVAIGTADFGGSPEVTFDFRGEPSSVGAVTLVRGGTTHRVEVDELGGITLQ